MRIEIDLSEQDMRTLSHTDIHHLLSPHATEQYKRKHLPVLKLLVVQVRRAMDDRDILQQYEAKHP